MNCQITGTARLAADPELRLTPGGKEITDVRLAFSNSTKKRDGDGYTYSPAIWVTATLWGRMAENAVETLRKGDEVIASGQLEKEEFEKRDGTRGEKLVLKFAEVAPSIRREVPFVRTDMHAAGQQRQAARPAAGRSDTRAPAGRPQARPQVVDDPWATEAARESAAAGFDTPPF